MVRTKSDEEKEGILEKKNRFEKVDDAYIYIHIYIERCHYFIIKNSYLIPYYLRII